MLGLMQSQPLLVSSILTHAARHHAAAEVVSREADGRLVRSTYAAIEVRARKLARALQALGVQRSDRVATLAWNSQRHLELYYAVSGMGSVVHTVNPRLAPDDIAHILNDAGSIVLCADPGFAPLVQALRPRLPALRHVVFLADTADMPPQEQAGDALCYETLMAEASEDFAWPVLDENLASALCYTSGTTGRPKGVLYSHRSTLVHAYAVNLADVFGLRAVDRVMPVVPMFHVNAWGLPYAAPMVGASLVMPGRQLDGPSVHALMNAERVTFSAGVPTVWMGLLQHLRATGGTLDTLKRLVCGGSACPAVLIDTFGGDYGVEVSHAWGMTETSPLATMHAFKPEHLALPDAERARLPYKQGRAVPGLDMRIIDDQGHDLPWDGATFGNLVVRGPWVVRRYYGADQDACDPDGWFATGDVATIDPSGSMEITDRTKDIVKSGGEWISSIQLENIAVGHPDVAEAAIVAAKHEKWDERPLLIVVAKPGREIDKPALLASYAGQVAKWWIPDEVVVVEELPHTATGKLNKLALRQQFKDFRLTC
ncbi:MAG: long-chain-fatty-acid--CoA ligase [Janthinobacterium lividum]